MGPKLESLGEDNRTTFGAERRERITSPGTTHASMTGTLRATDLVEGAQPTHRCLIVDDEPHLRRMLVRLMESEGFACDEAANGREALRIMEQQPASLVLSDLHMPELDGIGLLRELRT